MNWHPLQSLLPLTKLNNNYNLKVHISTLHKLLKLHLKWKMHHNFWDNSSIFSLLLQLFHRSKTFSWSPFPSTINIKMHGHLTLYSQEHRGLVHKNGNSLIIHQNFPHTPIKCEKQWDHYINVYTNNTDWSDLQGLIQRSVLIMSSNQHGHVCIQQTWIMVCEISGRSSSLLWH